MLVFVDSYDWELEQYDVKIVFLHGDLDEKIFINQHKGFESKDKLIMCVFKEISLSDRTFSALVA